MRQRLATLAATALMLTLVVPAAAVSASSAIHVRHDQSIQDAIDSAPAGGRIYVAPGTYQGNLEITRSVHLIGDHAVIVPAATDNLCLGERAFYGVVGICVHGAFNTDGSITLVSNVSIEGFTVRKFGGPGIVAFGVDRLRLADMVTAHNGEMGMFINTVSNISLLDNRSYGNGADGISGDGIFVENSSANAVITGNKLYDNLGSGIFFFNSLGGRLANNDLYGNCAGILVASVAVNWPDSAPLSGDVLIQRNQVTANNRLCPEVLDHNQPAFGGIGIALIGVQKTTVARNEVRNNRSQAGSGIHGGGIVILDGVIFGAGPSTGNSVRLNQLSGNKPYDIYGDPGTATANTVSGNTCHKTNLGGC